MHLFSFLLVVLRINIPLVKVCTIAVYGSLFYSFHQLVGVANDYAFLFLFLNVLAALAAYLKH